MKSWPWPTRKSAVYPLNTDQVSAWLPDRECIWKQHGVWDIVQGKPTLLQADYFSKKRDGTSADFYIDFYAPFLREFCKAIRRGNPECIFLMEPLPNEEPPVLVQEKENWHTNTIYAPHWYDLNSVFSKSFTGFITHDVQGLTKVFTLIQGKNIFQSSYFGLMGAKRNYTLQISNVVKQGIENLGQKPCLIGECGIPMDINRKKAYASGDYTHHTNFLDAVISSLEVIFFNVEQLG